MPLALAGAVDVWAIVHGRASRKLALLAVTPGIVQVRFSADSLPRHHDCKYSQCGCNCSGCTLESFLLQPRPCASLGIVYGVALAEVTPIAWRSIYGLHNLSPLASMWCARTLTKALLLSRSAPPTTRSCRTAIGTRCRRCSRRGQSPLGSRCGHHQ